MASQAFSHSAIRTPTPLVRFGPGLALCAAISMLAYAMQFVEVGIMGHPFVEALVLAILIGTAVRTLWKPGRIFAAGITFSAKTLLEIAVMLLGLSLSASALAAAGLPLLAGIAGVVVASLLVSYGISRGLGLSHTMSVLIASGNSICGNSAIAAVASVIGADGDDVASSIAFTAILGIIVVLTLPFAAPLLHMSEVRYGALAGLTVYAVPQVLAATVPVGALAVQLGTLVKLVRVVMLGPVVFIAALTATRKTAGDAEAQAAKLPFLRLVPWFVIGFALLSLLRSLGGVPEPVVPVVAQVTTVLTVLSMAALGLGVDLGTLRKVGGRVTLAVVLSVVALALISYSLVTILHI